MSSAEQQTLQDNRGPTMAARPRPADSAAPAPPTVERHATEWSGDHPIDIRISVPYGFGRFYLTVVGGLERRNPHRLAAERRKHPLIKAGNLLLFFALGTVLGLAALSLLNLLTLFVFG